VDRRILGSNLNRVPAPGTATSHSVAWRPRPGRRARSGRSPSRSGAMVRVLRPGGLLALTSRNWELVRDEGCGLRIGAQPAERDGRRALVVYGWSLADSWDDRRHLDIAVAIVELAGKVEQPPRAAGVLAVSPRRPRRRCPGSSPGHDPLHLRPGRPLARHLETSWPVENGNQSAQLDRRRAVSRGERTSAPSPLGEPTTSSRSVGLSSRSRSRRPAPRRRSDG
jgi:hypothetical protein